MKATFPFIVLCCCCFFGLCSTQTTHSQDSATLQKDQLPSVMLPSKIPLKARTIASFNRLKLGMSMKQFLAACGLPDADIGSGIHIYVYELSDGSRVLVGTPNAEQIIYVVQVLANGAERQIMKSSPQGGQSIKGRSATAKQKGARRIDRPFVQSKRIKRG